MLESIGLGLTSALSIFAVIGIAIFAIKLGIDVLKFIANMFGGSFY